MLPVITVGSLLPTWMFINSLQIIAHLTLLKTIMPANGHYFLKKYLDLLRWYQDDFVFWLNEQINFKRYHLETGAYHTLLNTCDYDHLISKNMFMVLIVFAVTLILWILCIIKDMNLHMITRKGSCLNKKQSPWCFNFILRFFYEFFFEFCICVVVQLSVKDFSSFSLGFQFLLSLAVTVVSIALISFIISLLFCKGPSIPGFYLKGTAASSVFEKRKLDPNFDAKKHLQQHTPAPIASWGSRIV